MWGLRIGFVASMLTLLAGCQSAPSDPREQRGVLPASGTVLKLHQDLTVPAGTQRVFIQYGTVTAGSDLNQPYPYCKFELFGSVEDLEAPRTILADEFVVNAAYRRRESVVGLDVPRLAFSIFMNADGRSEHTLALRMDIASPRQPHVDTFVCAVWGESDIFNYPSPAEIENTLGGVATLMAPDA